MIHGRKPNLIRHLRRLFTKPCQSTSLRTIMLHASLHSIRKCCATVAKPLVQEANMAEPQSISQTVVSEVKSTPTAVALSDAEIKKIANDLDFLQTLAQDLKNQLAAAGLVLLVPPTQEAPPEEPTSVAFSKRVLQALAVQTEPTSVSGL